VANWFADVYHQPAAVTEEITNQSRNITKGLNSFEEKLRVITAFIQENIRYVAVEIGKWRWKPRLAAKTLYNR